ncbi:MULTISPECIES: recombinase family protein [unclassified Caballeronia]|uniref:recombinase family protein n=2 Tax=Caballeronia TaxID=1827195 RepID=UPI001F44473B|nr:MULTISPECIES: recombinase family protein [unclassified Caballeronia]MCE4547380.1 recombinase family protein [Caballeronia sp. PC1]MCE4547476.1 recombinase family protein [Caballeronia sp. PC1]MCE4575364.1 recombinase family protein [Caballeronia sp. CLC5]MDR5749140.1 recombinase family protein [Caballeronia sp. LZ029]
MSTDPYQKVTADHLRRDAFLYVRQSSLRQVFENTESTKRQYALRERAVSLGWPIERVHVIDSDLGLSGASAEDRDGFQQLVSEVAIGHAGIVLGLEVSRLARNNADWHRLIELAALTHTLILDEDGVYDPAYFNDRLLLGLKGTMSEAELHVLNARLQGGMRNKARRGELELPLPIGLVYHPNGSVVLDPDQQIHASLRLLFDTYRQTHSASMVVRRFRREGWVFPRRIRRGIGKGEVQWGGLNTSRVLQILHNPRYAGAFVYGRTRIGRKADLTSTQFKVAQSDWQVLIRSAHVGYIDWDEFERNQVTLRQSANGFGSLARGTVPREGDGLLQGRVICGLCGNRMRVRYQKVSGRLEPYYVCHDVAAHDAGKPCQSVRGRAIDDAISALLLQTVGPAAIEVALAVEDEIAGRIEQANSMRLKQLERARYEAELARRRYMNVDPANRMVADALEADWNDRLRRLDVLQQEHERQRRSDQDLLGDEARARIRALADDFAVVWNDRRIESVERKRMLRLLIDDVTLVKSEKVSIHVRFRGGRTISLAVDKPRSMALVRKTQPAVVTVIDGLLETCTDQQVATRLNELGYTNWQHQTFTARKVALVRTTYGLPSRYERLRARGLLTGAELATQLEVSQTTIHQWGRQGLLRRHVYGHDHRCLYEPPGNVPLVRGTAGRKATQATFIAAPTTGQGAM